MAETQIHNVSDTALWVATFRARENQRRDALFKDPYAERLAGERGPQIARSMARARYTEWVVVTRTVMIDSFIEQLIAEGVDAVVNLGAGLDTRPYRMNLPKALRWYEVDYEPILAMKVEKLVSEIPTCTLERLAVDLTNAESRNTMFAHVTKDASKVLVLTEGVIPYLSVEQVSELAAAMRGHPEVRYWIADYATPAVYGYYRRTAKQMRNAPFKFFPDDWHAFFGGVGWQAREVRFYMEESDKLGRRPPFPWWMKALTLITPKKQREAMEKSAGYALLTPKN